MYEAPRLSALCDFIKKIIAKSYLTTLQGEIFIFLLKHLKIEKKSENLRK